jgi:Ca2+-binding RTX toxin-like protein
MAGAGGDDTYTVDDIGDVVIELAGGGEDHVRSSISHMLGAFVERLTLLGSGHIAGTGNVLPNVISGNSGRNTLVGGVGRDTLTGGGGADTFLYQAIEDGSGSEDQADFITDFSSTQADRIDISRIDAIPTSATDNAFAFVGGAPFSAAGQLRFYYSGDNTFASFNTDADFNTSELIISLAGQISLAASSFVL